MKKSYLILFIIIFGIHANAQVTLSTDFTNNALKKMAFPIYGQLQIELVQPMAQTLVMD